MLRSGTKCTVSCSAGLVNSITGTGSLQYACNVGPAGGRLTPASAPTCVAPSTCASLLPWAVYPLSHALEQGSIGGIQVVALALSNYGSEPVGCLAQRAWG
jgi:hypothetical protein